MKYLERGAKSRLKWTCCPCILTKNRESFLHILPFIRTLVFFGGGCRWILYLLVCFVLLCFYGISTIVGYLMPDPFFLYILNMLG